MIKEFKNLWWLLQWQHCTKIEFCVWLLVFGYSMLVMLYKMSRVSFHLINTNASQERQRMKNFLLFDRYVVRTWNVKISRCWLGLFHIGNIVHNRQNVLSLASMVWIVFMQARIIAQTKIWEFQGVICHFHPKISLKTSGTYSSIIFPHSTKQIIDLWCCLCCCRCHLLNSQFNLLWQRCVN